MNPELQKQLEIFLQMTRAGALKFAANRCGSVDDALDLLQEAMIDFVGVADQYQQEAWKNLLYKILVRRITDRFRKGQWRTRLAKMINFSHYGDEEITPEPVDFVDGEDSYNVGKLTETFDLALKALPARQQEAYMLRQWQQLSVKQTADVMDCSEGSVKTHLSRAMKNLEHALGDWIND
ncbi:MAG TPA: sigma-70 family RNA polymerase sigma factor [Gammaproteobacteria bacterium]|nr:sigma-70 family RNA polymerase sigma factor [Gammaproteobacteria bacterium]